MQPRKIGIVGLGLIGGSLALALRRADPSLQIVGVDSVAHTRDLAVSERAVDAAYELGKAPLDECDLVVLAVPGPALIELLAPVSARMRKGAILTDVCGAKERICEAAALLTRVVFIGGHPMAGTEYRGFSAATPTLFFGCTVALCPGDESALGAVRDLWTAAGAATVLEVSPAEHDSAVTYASHLPYLAAAATVEAFRSSTPLAGQLAAGGFRDTTRLAGDGTVSGAASLNRFVPEAARALSQTLRALADQLEQDPLAALKRLESLADERRQMKLPSPSR
jgi:prephenate dehydrogenase